MQFINLLFFHLQVLAITEGAEGAHDVYRLAKEAAAQHSNLMSELNKVRLLLPGLLGSIRYIELVYVSLPLIIVLVCIELELSF